MTRVDGEVSIAFASAPRRAVAEALGTAFLLAAVVGSGIMAERLAGGNVAIALLANTLATGAMLVVLILTFGSEAELSRLAGDWEMTRLAEIWNNLPGVTPLTRFKDRKTAIRRIWKAIHGAKLIEDTQKTGVMRGVVRAKRLVPESNPAGKGTKTEQIIALLRAPSGASMKSIMIATGWQVHSVRGFVSAQQIGRAHV